jgi:hypothetical protein
VQYPDCHENDGTGKRKKDLDTPDSKEEWLEIRPEMNI